MYLLAGCCRYKAEDAQAYNTYFKRLFQLSGNAVDAVPCEQIPVRMLTIWVFMLKLNHTCSGADISHNPYQSAALQDQRLLCYFHLHVGPCCSRGL